MSSKIKSFKILISHAENLAFKSVPEEKKKKYSNKWRVIIIDDKGRKKSTPIVQNPSGNPRWDTEVEVKCHPKGQPTIMLVTDSEENHVGQVYINPDTDVAEIPEQGVDPLGIWSRRCQDLEPTKKNSYPQGRLYYWAWALSYVDDPNMSHGNNFVDFLKGKNHSRTSSFLVDNSQDSRSREISRVSSTSEMALAASQHRGSTASIQGPPPPGPDGHEKRRSTWKASLLNLAHVGSFNESRKSKPDISQSAIAASSKKRMTLPAGIGGFQQQKAREETGDLLTRAAPSLLSIDENYLANRLLQDEDYVFASLPHHFAHLEARETREGVNQVSPPSKDKAEMSNNQQKELYISMNPSQGSVKGGYSILLTCRNASMVPTVEDLLGVYVDSQPVDKKYLQWIDAYNVRIATLPPAQQPCQCFIDVDTALFGLQRCENLFMYLYDENFNSPQSQQDVTSPTNNISDGVPFSHPKGLSKSLSCPAPPSPVLTQVHPCNSIQEEPANDFTSKEHASCREGRASSFLLQLHTATFSNTGKLNPSPPPSALVHRSTLPLIETQKSHMRNPSETSGVWQALPKWPFSGTTPTSKENKPTLSSSRDSLVDALNRELDQLRQENETLTNTLREKELEIKHRNACIQQLSDDLFSLRNRLLVDNLIQYLERSND